MTLVRTIAVAVCVWVCLSSPDRPVHAQASPLFLGLGDSIGEAVQSGNASAATQPYSFLHLMARHMGRAFPLPLIESGAFASVGDVSGRSRIDPAVNGYNLAVSGADLFDLLFTRADATIDSETDLVLSPRQASQIEIVESMRPDLVAVWIGNNDSLSSVLNVATLDGVTGLTPLGDFTSRFTALTARLAATGAKVVVGTLPKVTRIGYLVNRAELVRFTGQDWGLPEDSLTTLTTMVGLQLGTTDPAVINEPAFVLTPDEMDAINNRIDAFNQVIRSSAAQHGFAVADMASVFDDLAANPPVIAGVPLTTRFLGGLFSLDGVHPGNFAHAIIAQVFLAALNQQYGLSIPPISNDGLWYFFLNDPFIDKDGDGRVPGRPGAGLLESVAPLLGWSGDTSENLPAASVTVDTVAAIGTIERQTGKSLRRGSQRQRLEVLNDAFGLRRFAAKRR